MPHPWPLFRSLAGLKTTDIRGDLLAGLTLAAIAIPEQMATAQLGHFPAQIGFFAFVAGGLAFAAFGASRFVSVGADSTITPIFAPTLAMLAGAQGSPEYLAQAQMLALLVGIMLVIGGIGRIGWIADLLSQPVVTGFLAGISVHIVLSQLPTVLGLPSEDASVYQRVASLIAHADQINPAAVAIGLGVLAITLACEKWNPRLPGALIGLAAATAVVLLLGPRHGGVVLLGDVPAGMPRVALPHVDVQEIYALLPMAFLITLVVMVQTSATTRSFPDGDQAPDIDRDFVGAGAGSVLAGVLGAFPVNASPPRTSVVSDSGGRSQVASLSAVAVVLLLVNFGTSLLADVPKAALAGVLLFVAQRIFRLQSFIAVYRRTRGEFALILATMIAIVLLPIQIGVAMGIFLSLLHGVYIITRARLIELQRIAGTTIWWPVEHAPAAERVEGVLVVAFQAPLSFLNAYEFRRGILEAIGGRTEAVRLVVLEANSIGAIDFTAADVLATVVRECRKRGHDFAVARLESVRAQEAFGRFGLTELIGKDHIFHSVQDAITKLAKAA
jgi:MFS superfamily sulfate permease-like transporter